MYHLHFNLTGLFFIIYIIIALNDILSLLIILISKYKLSMNFNAHVQNVEKIIDTYLSQILI